MKISQAHRPQTVPAAPTPDETPECAECAELQTRFDALYEDAAQIERNETLLRKDVADLTSKNEKLRAELVAESTRWRPPSRIRLPDERQGLTHKFTIFATKDDKPISYKGYVTMSFYDAPEGALGSLGEIFFKIDRAGSEVSGLCDAWAINASLLLQYGVPFDVIATKHRGAKFEPSGFTSNKDPALRTCSSPIDYVVRYIAAFLVVRRASAPCEHGRVGGYLCPHCEEVIGTVKP